MGCSSGLVRMEPETKTSIPPWDPDGWHHQRSALGVERGERRRRGPGAGGRRDRAPGAESGGRRGRAPVGNGASGGERGPGAGWTVPFSGSWKRAATLRRMGNRLAHRVAVVELVAHCPFAPMPLPFLLEMPASSPHVRLEGKRKGEFQRETNGQRELRNAAAYLANASSDMSSVTPPCLGFTGASAPRPHAMNRDGGSALCSRGEESLSRDSLGDHSCSPRQCRQRHAIRHPAWSAIHQSRCVATASREESRWGWRSALMRGVEFESRLTR
uniref:Uncharacterized protein n=1 Tax=Setaria italica TaxID=4555 RepID=K3ZJJ5_SETIT